MRLLPIAATVAFCLVASPPRFRAADHEPAQEAPFVVSAKSGAWSDLATWQGGKVPGAGSRVRVAEGHTVTYDVQSDLVIRLPDGTVKKQDVRHIPLFRFEDNEAHSTGLYGIVFADIGNHVRGDKQHPFIARKLRVWHTTYAFRPNVDFLLAEDVKIHATAYGIRAPSLDHQVFRDITLTRVTATIIASRPEKYPDGVTPLPRATFENVTIADRPGNMGFGAKNRFEAHFKNLTVKNSGPHGILGNKERTRQPYKGVYYFHDYPKKGSVALVAHQDVAAKDAAKDFRTADFLRGGQLRTAERKDVAFPTDLLSPVDDLAPATTITSVERRAGKLLVRGVTHDNGAVRSVVVNGIAAKLQWVQVGLADWEALVDASADGLLAARATDQAGNEETPGHRLPLTRLSANGQ